MKLIGLIYDDSGFAPVKQIGAFDTVYTLKDKTRELVSVYTNPTTGKERTDRVEFDVNDIDIEVCNYNHSVLLIDMIDREPNNYVYEFRGSVNVKKYRFDDRMIFRFWSDNRYDNGEYIKLNSKIYGDGFRDIDFFNPSSHIIGKGNVICTTKPSEMVKPYIEGDEDLYGYEIDIDKMGVHYIVNPNDIKDRDLRGRAEALLEMMYNIHIGNEECSTSSEACVAGFIRDILDIDNDGFVGYHQILNDILMKSGKRVCNHIIAHSDYLFGPVENEEED